MVLGNRCVKCEMDMKVILKLLFKSIDDYLSMNGLFIP